MNFIKQKTSNIWNGLKQKIDYTWNTLKQNVNGVWNHFRPYLALFFVGLLSVAIVIGFILWMVYRPCRRPCSAGYYCYDCYKGVPTLRKCVRGATTDPFKLVNNSQPFNKYALLTTHNSFAIRGYNKLTFCSQTDSIEKQLRNGVRAFMLDVYDFRGDIWLCHSFNGKCHGINAFVRAVDTLKTIEVFLSSNPTEVVTIILEDYVKTHKGLSNMFLKAGLEKYWFPLSEMPIQGDWPLVSDMVAKNQRLIVFTSKRHKEITEGIAYQWNYMVESHYGDKGMWESKCTNRGESSPLNDTTKSLVLVNFFRDIPMEVYSCVDNSDALLRRLINCHEAAGRWANFVAVDFYRRNDGGGVFDALDMLNGELLCGQDDVHNCSRTL